MKSPIIIPLITFFAGAILMMLLLDKCNSVNIDALKANLKKYQDSVKVIVDSNEVLIKERSELSFEKLEHDSLNGKTIDSLKTIIKRVKTNYYTDTVKFKIALQNLQEAFNSRDSAKAQNAIDSLVIEARSANWSATNIFYQYDEMDSVWRLQKAYDDSTYHVLYLIDSAKDGRFNALLSVNNQMAADYEKALKEIQRLKNGKKFWFAIGALLGLSTNFWHK